jgi:hypothetical protein
VNSGQTIQHPFAAARLGRGIGILLFALGSSSHAQTLHVLPSDKGKLAIHGKLGDDASLTTKITLLSDQVIPELLFRPGALDGPSGIHVASSQIQLGTSGKISLGENTPYDVDLKVAGIKVSGVYTGAIDFLLPKRGTNSLVQVNLELTVDPILKLQTRKGSESVKIQIVNCNSWTCKVAGLLEPAASRNSYAIPFDNVGSNSFSVNANLSATGERNWGEIGNAVHLTSPIQITASPIAKIPLTVASGEVAADHYLGDMQIVIPGQEAPLKIPLEVNVKDGPIWAIFTLLVGVLMGRLIKYMKDKGTPQADLLQTLHQLQTRSEQSPADAVLLKMFFDKAAVDIRYFRFTDAQADLTKIDNLLTLLAHLTHLEIELQPRSAEPAVAAILALIKQARATMQLGSDPSQLANQIESAVTALPAPAAPASGVFQTMIAKNVSVAAQALADVARAPHPSRVRWVAKLIGYDETVPEHVTFWFLRPLLWVLLILGLLVVGLQQLYLKDPAFGSMAFNDYFGLFVWGTSADVASRTLSNLGK